MRTDPVFATGSIAATAQTMWPCSPLRLLAGTGGCAARASAHWFFITQYAHRAVLLRKTNYRQYTNDLGAGDHLDQGDNALRSELDVILYRRNINNLGWAACGPHMGRPRPPPGPVAALPISAAVCCR